MSFTGIRDVDIDIISFCDLETILTLASIKKLQQLIEEAMYEIVKFNLDSPSELAEFTIDLIDANIISLAQKFIKITITFDDNDESWYYYKIIMNTYLRQDILEIYFASDCNYDGIIGYIRDYLDDYLQFYFDDIFTNQDIRDCLTDLTIFYQAAVNTENTAILKFLVDYCNSGFFDVVMDKYNDVTMCEDIVELNSEAEKIIINDFIV